MFKKHQEIQEIKEIKVCSVCGCVYEKGKEVEVHGSYFSYSGYLSIKKFCLADAPKYDKEDYSPYVDIGTVYFKNNVPCDKNGIPLVGLNKPTK